MMRKKVISLQIATDLDRRVRIEAARRDQNRSTFIRQTLVEKLAQIERQHSQAADQHVEAQEAQP